MKPKSYRKRASKRKVTPETAISSAQLEAADTVVQGIRADLPSLMAVAVVDVNSGKMLASHSNSISINPETAATYNTEVVRQKQKALAALALEEEQIDEILITLRHQLHLIKLTDAGHTFVYLVVKSSETSLAVAREVVRSQALLLS
ncbi:hypothetical protein [Hymenobacter sp. GOD-10R]|uniref:hypothetical protein n=1 Tax=Hymenobacter sp. GOD-10R TaxID=3093922 RepID=UPI002D79EE23|nr:hypothetical protein [Hymenobacter sp. GOD-10R]WRQ28975.1 hypothetical protein SD425_01695 [Hymenobacter sp. GOD-10R]